MDQSGLEAIWGDINFTRRFTLQGDYHINEHGLFLDGSIFMGPSVMPDWRVLSFLADFPGWKGKIHVFETYGERAYDACILPRFFNTDGTIDLNPVQLFSLITFLSVYYSGSKPPLYGTIMDRMSVLRYDGMLVEKTIEYSMFEFFQYDSGSWHRAGFSEFFPSWILNYNGPPNPQTRPPVFDFGTWLTTLFLPWRNQPVSFDDVRKQGKIPIPYIGYDYNGSKTGIIGFYWGWIGAAGAIPPATINITNSDPAQMPADLLRPVAPKSTNDKPSEGATRIKVTPLWSNDGGKTFGTLKDKHRFHVDQTISANEIRELVAGSGTTTGNATEGKIIEYIPIDKYHGYITIELIH